jgi:hypothetical protein
MLGYLLPIIFVAIYFGSTVAVLTSVASGLAAAYFLLPPKFSFYVDDPVSSCPKAPTDRVAPRGFAVHICRTNPPFRPTSFPVLMA